MPFSLMMFFSYIHSADALSGVLARRDSKREEGMTVYLIFAIVMHAFVVILNRV